MLQKVSQIKGFAIAATDGEMGKVANAYFDDEKWTVRFLVVDTGNWLPGRKVLLSPSDFSRIDWQGENVETELTREQVEKSPDIDTEKPVSRQEEMAYYDYYQRPYYWAGPYIWGPVALPRERADWSPSQADEIRAAAERQQEENTHLRSANEVTGYHVEATDGNIGHIEDLVVDDDSWTIRYVIVDTRNWLPGKSVLVSPELVTSIGSTQRKVHVHLSQDQIKKSPEFE